MKGIVFTALNDMVEQKLGIDVWESALENVNPPSGGIYTSVENFPDSELAALVADISLKTGIPQTALLEQYGKYLFQVLAKKHSGLVTKEPDFLNFLKSIDDEIHKEVEKLYKSPDLPSLKWNQPGPDVLILNYESPRKLCALAVGLIHGAAEYFNVNIELGHETCLHRGDDSCQLSVKLLA